jgi:ribosomal protein S18 acetylase RimI-like enzyme
MNVEIRTVHPGDEALFGRIADEVFDNPIEPGVLSRFLATPAHHLVVAIADGWIVGQVSAVVHRHPDQRPTELYVDEVGVSPAYRRRGIATLMLERMFTLGRAEGCVEAWLGTEPDNEAARALYAPMAQPAEDVVMYVFKL